MAYGTRGFNAASQKGYPIILSWTESIQFLVLKTFPLTSNYISYYFSPVFRLFLSLLIWNNFTVSLRSIRILSSYLRLGFPKGFFPVDLPVKILKALLPSSILPTWPAHLNPLYLITLTILGKRYKLCSSSLWSLLNTPLGPNIRLRIQLYIAGSISNEGGIPPRYHPDTAKAVV